MPPVSCWRTGRWTWAASSARNQDLCHKALCHFYASAMLALNKPQTWGPEGWDWVSPHWVLVQEATKHPSHAQALLVDVAQGPLELLWAGNLPKGLQPQWGKLNCHTQCFSIRLQMMQLQWAFSNSLASPKFSGLSLVDFLPWAQLHGSPVPWVPNLRQVYGSGPAGVGTCHMRRWSGTKISCKAWECLQMHLKAFWIAPFHFSKGTRFLAQVPRQTRMAIYPSQSQLSSSLAGETAAKLPGSSPIHMKNVGSVGAPGKSEWIRFEHVFFDVILVSVFSLKFSHHKSSSASLQTSSGRFESCEDKTETA